MFSQCMRVQIKAFFKKLIQLSEMKLNITTCIFPFGGLQKKKKSKAIQSGTLMGCASKVWLMN